MMYTPSLKKILVEIFDLCNKAYYFIVDVMQRHFDRLLCIEKVSRTLQLCQYN